MVKTLASSCSGKETDHWLVEEQMILEDIPTFPSAQLNVWSHHSCQNASKLSEPPIRLRPKPSWRERERCLGVVASSPPSGGNWDSTHWKWRGGGGDNRNPTYSHTVLVQTLWKNGLVLLSSLYKIEGVLQQPGVLFFHRWVWCFVFTLDVKHVCFIVFTPVLWYRRTLETFGTGLMHYVNKCKQVSDSQINQKI